jgi:molybdopterin/thiamine biosynthesis adenylyltransferase
LREVDTLDRAGWDRFRLELIEAGFSSDDGGRTWRGPIAEQLRGYTTSTWMELEVRDGWPYLQPQLRVPDMQPLEHVNQGGTVCLWPEGDRSQAWTTWAGFEKRIDEWCAAQEGGFEPADATMDADAYFSVRDRERLATMDLSEVVAASDGDLGRVWGRWHSGETHLEITTQQGGGLEGLWFLRDRLEAQPRTAEEFLAQLTEAQQVRFRRLLGDAAKSRRRQRRVAVLVWGNAEARNALVLLIQLERGGGQVAAHALEFAPTDLDVLRRRSGDDAEQLESRRVVIFGAGAVGSHVALQLAECGLGAITLVDKERLRPGNVVRHAAPRSSVGLTKVEATATLIGQHAPWTAVERREESLWAPASLRGLMEGHDLVIDATGSLGFLEQLAWLTAGQEVALVTAALYRRGWVARVSRQAPGDKLLSDREDGEEYPAIPPGANEQEGQLEAGCSAPVNEASPRAVVACAEVAAGVAIDWLTGRHDMPDEITEIYRPLDDRPFDRVAWIASG